MAVERAGWSSEQLDSWVPSPPPSGTIHITAQWSFWQRRSAGSRWCEPGWEWRGNSTPELPSGNKLDVGLAAGQWAETGRRRRRCLKALAIHREDRVRRQPLPVSIWPTAYCCRRNVVAITRYNPTFLVTPGHRLTLEHGLNGKLNRSVVLNAY